MLLRSRTLAAALGAAALSITPAAIPDAARPASAAAAARDAMPAPDAAPAGPVLIKGGTLLTISHGAIERGDLLIRDGKIAAVGGTIAPPAGARVLDAAGRFVMPGIVDTHSHMGVYPWPEVEANSDGNEATDPITSWMRAADSVYTEDPEFERARAGGVTTVQILPGSANLIGGESLTVKLRPGPSLERMRFEGAPRGIKMALGENPKRVYGARDKTPSTRMGNMAVFRQAFSAARDYRAKWDAWRARPEKDRGLAPDRDLKLESLADVLDGKVLVHVHSYRKDEILRFLEIADEYGFKVASFQHCLEGYKIPDVLARRDIAVATFAHWWGYKVEAWDGIPHNAAILARAGVRVSIHSDSGNLVQRLYNEAAVAARYGLSADDALKAITINAATAIGVGDRIGTLDVGKDADIAIFTRHPLDAYTLVEKTLIDGAVVYDRGTVPTPATLPPAPPLPKGPSAPPASALVPPPDPVNPKGLYAITGGRVFTLTGPPIDDATIVVQDGLIRDVRKGAKPPAGATVIDAAGGWVFPGFIEAGTHLGLSEIDLEDVTRDEDEATDPVLPQMQVMDAFYTESEVIPVARLHGLTAAFTAPGDGNVFGGTGAVVRLDGDNPAAVVVKDRAALVVNLGEPPKARYGPKHQSPDTRMGIAALVRDAFVKATDYRARRADYEKKLREFESQKGAGPAAGARPEAGIKPDAKTTSAGDSKGDAAKPAERPTPPDRDLKLEALLPALDGSMPVVVRAQRVDDILTAVRLADEFKLRLILNRAAEAYKVADLLASRNIPVLVGPITTQPDRIETLGAVYDNAARLRRAGVKIAIQSGDTLNARMLPYEASLAVAYGLPWDDAIRAITADAAEILGVADRIGTLQPGREADLIVTAGDPLQPLTPLRHMMIKGRPIPLTSRQTALYEQWRR